MSKSKWKQPFLKISLIKDIFLKKTKKVFSKSSTIPSLLLYQTVQVYNGKTFKSINITREKIGFKFGEFVKTRKSKKVILLDKKSKKPKKPKKPKK